MNYKLICIDIDGTLLDDNKKLMPEVVQSIRNAAKMGIKIALVSGRMPAAISMIEKELGVQCIRACNAGTYILLGEQCIKTTYLSPDTMQKIDENLAKKNNIPLWFFRNERWFVTYIDEYVENEMQIIHRQPEIVLAEEMVSQWKKEKTGPNKLLFCTSPEKIKKLYCEMETLALDDVDFACSAEDYMEIFPKGMTKGVALLSICQELNISKEETIAFGDQQLDITMIEEAGLGIAMGNAIQELKDKADFVTKSNNEAGIAYALEKYLTD